MPGFRDLARNRDFTVLWVGETVSELGNRMSAFVYPLLALALGGSAGAAALVQAAYFGGIVLVLLPAGVLADRLHRRRVLRAVSLMGLLLYAVMAAALAADVLTVGGLAAGAALAGLCAGVYEPAQLSAIRSVVTTEQLPTALAQNQARGQVAGLLGAPLGGVLLAVTRWAPFLVDAATYLVSFVTLGRIRTDLSAPPIATGERRGLLRGLLGDVRDGAGFVVRQPVFRVLAVWSAWSNLVVNALIFVVLIRMAQAGHSAGAIGLAMAATGAAGIVGALLAPQVIERVPTGLLTAAVGWACAVPLVPLIWFADPVAAAVCVGALVLLNPMGNAGIGAYRIAMTPAALQGRVNATTAFVSWSVMPLAPVLGGLALELLGGEGATALLLVGCVIAALIVTLSPAIRRVPRPAQWRASQPVAAAA